MANLVFLIGRLTRDPEVRYTPEQMAIARFSLAVDRPVGKGKEKQTDFPTVVVFGKQAENCKWETRYNQDRNRRNTIKLTYNGETMCMADWSRELGIPFTTMLGRLRKGKSTEEILSKNKLAKRSGNGRWKAM